MTSAQNTPDLVFDPDEIRARYAYERKRRLRSDGARQYAPAPDAFSPDHDPYAPHAEGEMLREPVVETLDVLIILAVAFLG